MYKNSIRVLTGSSSVQDREGVDPDGGGVEERQRSQPIGNTVILEKILFLLLYKATLNYHCYFMIIKM